MKLSVLICVTFLAMLAGKEAVEAAQCSCPMIGKQWSTTIVSDGMQLHSTFSVQGNGNSGEFDTTVDVTSDILNCLINLEGTWSADEVNEDVCIVDGLDLDYGNCQISGGGACVQQLCSSIKEQLEDNDDFKDGLEGSVFFSSDCKCMSSDPEGSDDAEPVIFTTDNKNADSCSGWSECTCTITDSSSDDDDSSSESSSSDDDESSSSDDDDESSSSDDDDESSSSDNKEEEIKAIIRYIIAGVWDVEEFLQYLSELSGVPRSWLKMLSVKDIDYDDGSDEESKKKREPAQEAQVEMSGEKERVEEGSSRLVSASDAAYQFAGFDVKEKELDSAAVALQVSFVAVLLFAFFSLMF